MVGRYASQPHLATPVRGAGEHKGNVCLVKT